jgi:hypothetical protein
VLTSYYDQYDQDDLHTAQMANNPGIDGRTVVGDDAKRYEIAIPTRNLSWEHLAKYLELAFKGSKLQIPKDQKVSLPPYGCRACICLRPATNGNLPR